MKRIFITKLLGIALVISLAILIPHPHARADETATGDATTTPINIHLDIEGATSTLFNDSLDVLPCTVPGYASTTANGYCAIQESDIPSTWSSFGDDQFLNSVGGESNDFVNNFFWTWFADLEYGETSMNKHELTPGEHLLLTLSRMPLRLDVSNRNPTIGSTTTVSVLQFGFDASFNAVWSPAASSTIEIGDLVIPTNASGTAPILATSTSPFIVIGMKDGFLPSPQETIAPVVATSTSDSQSEVPQPSGGGGGGGGSFVSHHSLDVTNALNFLAAHQHTDGSFGSPLYTDWAAIALAAGPSSTARDKITAYLKTALDPSVNTTDAERHAMALMALGLNPYSDTQTNYIVKIVSAFDGTQIGDPSLVNDDIFALFPLIKAGYNSSDPIIQKILSLILSEQAPDGSWVESTDLTAAGIQSVSQLSSSAGVGDSIARGRTFLASHQSSDGGFGSSFSTSWALQAIAALSEGASNWTSNGNNPNDSLYALQQNDGGIEPLPAPLDTRVWATSYAIPAALGMPWPLILHSFSRLANTSSNTSNTSANAGDTSNNATHGEVLGTATTTLAESTDATTSQPIFVASSTPSTPLISPLNQLHIQVPPKPNANKKPLVTSTSGTNTSANTAHNVSSFTTKATILESSGLATKLPTSTGNRAAGRIFQFLAIAIVGIVVLAIFLFR